MTNLDRAALVGYCAAWGRMVRAERLLRKLGDGGADGLLTKTAKGNVIQNPLVGIANKAARERLATNPAWRCSASMSAAHRKKTHHLQGETHA